jgi:biotin-dependent carboxylase-like uncharacterized protein
MLEVLDGGLLSTVQDAGRLDWGHVGVPESGAADPWSRSVANLLVGNDPAAALVELTLVGGTFAALKPTTIGLAGADLGARIRGGRWLATWRSHRLAAGDIVDLPGRQTDDAATGRPGHRWTGCRAYLAIPGGIDVPVLLGSRSTCLPGGFGGLEGRPLQAGDRIGADPGADVTGTIARSEQIWPTDSEREPPDGRVVLRVLGPEDPALDAVLAGHWVVGSAADRVGIRLDPADDAALPVEHGRETVSQGVPWGTIQLPPDGHPIVLGPDHGTTGGYRVLGSVITADRPFLGQLAPGTALRVERTTRPDAISTLRRQHDALAAGAATLRDALAWDALAGEAGG